jgi:DNA-directed RNA polymerase specialized sigma24 family protein
VSEGDWLALRFEEKRTHLRAVAYQMLGSLSDADDAVQETWLRLSRSEVSSIENLGGWLTTVTARVCLDMLRSHRLRREEPLGVHVPDPIVSRKDGDRPRTRSATGRFASCSGAAARRRSGFESPCKCSSSYVHGQSDDVAIALVDEGTGA